jgi:uncharacterized protein YbjT (DUF2867 family)
MWNFTEIPSVKYVVKLSAMGIEGESYQVAKYHLEIENDLKNLGISWAMVRPNSFSQNIGNFFGVNFNMKDLILGVNKIRRVILWSFWRL